MTLRCKHCKNLVRPKMTKLGRKLFGFGWTAVVAIIDPKQVIHTQVHLATKSLHDKEGYLYCDRCERDVKIGELFA